MRNRNPARRGRRGSSSRRRRWTRCGNTITGGRAYARHGMRNRNPAPARAPGHLEPAPALDPVRERDLHASRPTAGSVKAIGGWCPDPAPALDPVREHDHWRKGSRTTRHAEPESGAARAPGLLEPAPALDPVREHDHWRKGLRTTRHAEPESGAGAGAGAPRAGAGAGPGAGTRSLEEGLTHDTACGTGIRRRRGRRGTSSRRRGTPSRRRGTPSRRRRWTRCGNAITRFAPHRWKREGDWRLVP